MAIRNNRQYMMAAPNDELGYLYDPMRDLLNIGNSEINNPLNIGGGGGGNTYIPAPTIPGNNIKLTLTNGSKFKNQMSFNVQNNVYQEGNIVIINANTINDELIIKPIVNDTYLIKNYYGLKKAIIDSTIEVTDYIFNYNYLNINFASSLINYQTNNNIRFNSPNTIFNKIPVVKKQVVKVAGITLSTYNVDGTIIGTENFTFPITTNLVFDLNTIDVPVVRTTTRIQSVFLTTNYNNSKLNDELNVIISSNDLSTPKTLKIGESIDIQNTHNIAEDLSILISGLSSFELSNIRWQYANKFDSNSIFNVNDFNILTSDTNGILSKSNFNSNIIILVEVKPTTSNYPTLTLDTNTVTTNIAESIFTNKETKIINITCNLSKADLIKVKTPYREFTQIASNNIGLDLQTDFQNNEGQFKILVTPYSELYGDGITQSLILTIGKVFDTPIIDKIEYPTNVLIPVYSFGDTNFTISFESKLATTVLIYHSTEDDLNLFGTFGANDKIVLNYNNIKAFNKNAKLDLLIVPYNGRIKGDIERISISFDDSEYYVSTQDLKDELFNAIASQLKLNLTKSSYLNHLASFDIDDKKIIISNWDVDNTTFTKFKTDELGNQIPDGEIKKSVVLKLYEPLPTNINKNDTLWISELSALPILQSVVITGILTDNCIPLRAPNFNIDVDFVKEQSTGFESYDNLILSGSTTSQQIVDKYLTENFIDVKGINIDYSNFSNFVKYSSATERLANFRYKKELVEWYDDKILSSSISASATTIALNLDIENYKTKKTNLITGFDGWETYLTQSVFTSSFTEANTVVVYNEYLDSATEYDRNNNNSLKNNIPLHIVEDTGNIDYLLFLDMIGNYFDIIWAYIKGMSDQKKITETNTDGIEDEFLYQYLKSFGWDAKNLNSNKQLWEYTFGLNNNAETSSFTSTKYLGENNNEINPITPAKATNQIWRRIANNLPYLLKHKGSVRGINALLTCYGIAASNLSIMEFGGPTVSSVEDPPKFIYNSLTHNLVFDNISASLEIPFIGTPKPQAIEFKFKPNTYTDYTLITGSGVFNIGIVRDTSPSIISNKYGYIKVNGSSVGSSYPFYDGNYHSILVNKSGSSVTVYAKTNDKDRIIQSGEWTKIIVESDYENTTTLSFTGFEGNLEEVRLWKNNLSESVFDNHVIMPEAINGNTLYSSTEDLLLRLDFEYPHKFSGSIEQISSGSIKDYIKNVAPNVILSNETSSVKYGERLLQSGYVANISASGFIDATDYPYNYEVLDREVSLTIPNTGASRYYTNKVRLESQKLTSNLSPLHRSTKKTFDTAPKDSNRVGLFFSPNKDLDLDIAKSLGSETFDDLIGDPQYEYNTINYPELDGLRNYYFERVGERNLYEFIRLIKFYDKSLFVNLKQMLPARAIVTTGLLIAPHLLERNRLKINRPVAVAESLQGTITDSQITDLIGTYNVLHSDLILSESLENISAVIEDYGATLDATTTYNFGADNVTYEGNISTDLINVMKGEYNTYEGEIDFRLKNATILTELDLNYGKSIIGFDNYSDYGFGTYFTNGYGKYHYEENGVFKSKGIRAFLVTKKHTILTQLTVNGISGSEVNTVTSSYSQELIVQDFSASVGLSLNGKDNIVSIATASGYLPSHYIYKGDKHTGVENLFYLGSKQTIDTTIDGKSPVETFTTNPTTLRVTAQGRGNNEPILEVD